MRFAIADCADAAVQVFRRGYRTHAAVDEPNKVRYVMIAKESENILASTLQFPGSVKIGAVFRITFRVAPEAYIARAAQHAFVRREPFEVEVHGDFQSLIGDGTFGGPESGGRLAKHTLVESPGA